MAYFVVGFIVNPAYGEDEYLPLFKTILDSLQLDFKKWMEMLGQ